MEEQKTKVVEINPQKAKEERPQKLSYEQLEQVAHQLSEQVNQLHTNLQKATLTNIFKRLDYLFKVLENHSIFSQEFTDKCVKEIEELMTIPEEDKSENNEQA